MNYPTFSRAVAFGGIGLLAATTATRANILVSLTPADTSLRYDSNVRGVVNDGGSGPADLEGHLSGIPVLDTAEHALGFTFNISFIPTAADLTGTRLLIEVGATSNGSGLYLVDGVPTFIGKQGANDAALPTSLSDTTLNTIAVQSSIGKLTAGIAYSVSASWNHAGTLELRAGEDSSGTSLLNSFAISGPPGNWSGNDTLSVKTIGKANAGGLSGNNAANVFGHPYDVDNASSLAGSVSRALFWNAHAVTPLTLTPPVVRGFSATRLPVGNKVRLHWNVSEGGLANPTTLSIKDSVTNAVVFSPTGLTGFADIPAGPTGFTLTATNPTGAVTGTSTVEADNSFSATVRADSPTAWFRFNDAAGSSLLADSAENVTPHDGTVVGQPVGGSTSFIDGIGAFEGGSSHRAGLLLNPAVVGSGPRAGFTIETVVRRRANVAGNHVLVSQADLNGGVGRVILGVNEAGVIYSNVGVGTLTTEGNPTVAAERKEADEKLETDRWAHLVVVVDPGIAGTPDTAEIRWYLDGKKIGSSLGGVNPGGSTFAKDFLLEPSTGDWIIGAAKTQLSEFWKGDIDDLAVYPNLLDDPDRNGDTADSTIAAHHASWYARTSGILSFNASATTVNTEGSVEFTIRTGADVTAVSIDHGVGSVPLTAGVGTVSVSPDATTTYRLTATGAGGVTYTRDIVVTYQQLTLPVILGLEKTTLPTTGQVRVHWRVSPGAFATPVTIGLNSGATVIPTDGSLVGFVDVTPAQAANITLTAENLIGPVSLSDSSAPAIDTAYSGAVRADSPVAWFRFNEKTGSQLVVDSAENVRPHNGTPLNTSINTGATGFVDGAGNFDGTRGVITDRIVNLNEIQEGFTIEAIVRNEPDAAGTANRAIVSQLDQNGTGRLIISVDDTGTIRSVFGGGVRKDADTKVIGQTWSHVVVVANAVTNTLRWYVDGQYAGTSADGQNPDGSLFDPNLLFEASEGAWTIGVHKTLTGNFWKGQIDEIAIYDTILDEIPGATPEDPVVIDATRVLAHRNAWYGETSGLLHAGLSAATIEPGASTQLTLKVGFGITSVTVPGVGTFPVVDGTVVITLTPSATTTYQVTLNGTGGPFIVPVTVTVNSVVPTVPLALTSWTKTADNFVLNFTGTPNTVYHIRGSTNLTLFDIPHGTATTDSSGAGTATITIDPLRKQEFYRVQAQP